MDHAHLHSAKAVHLDFMPIRRLETFLDIQKVAEQILY